MMEKHINVLLVEDNPSDVRLIRELLFDARDTRSDVTCVDQLSSGLELLAAGGIDVVLLDLGLPDSEGLESFTRAHAHAPEIPIVVLNGLDDETLAVKAVRGGAQDYLIKGHLNSSLLERSIRYAIERKQAEDALRRSETKYRALYESSKDGIVFSDMQGNLVDANQSFLDMLGYTLEEIKNLNYHQLTPKKWHEMEEDIVKNQVMARGYSDEYEEEYTKKDGTVFLVKIRVWMIKDGKGNPAGMRGMVRDITERKQTEEALRESEGKIRGILSSMVDLVFVFDRETRFIFYHSPSPSELYIPPDGFFGKKHSDVMPPHINQLFDDAFAKNKKGMPAEYEYRLKIGSETRWYSAKLSPIFLAEAFNGVVAVVRDITERKHTEEELQKHRNQLEDMVKERTQELYKLTEQLKKEIIERKRMEEQIQASLNEKELLLKEIHHRVKNNLQIISSLLNIQARSVKDGAALALFRESQDRVRSIALIHERLYRAKDLSRINFAAYIQQLTKGLFSAYKVDISAITLKTDVNACLDIETAIPCGLIVNEIVSNSLKHAFPEGRKGEISVTLHSNSDVHARESGEYVLTISDNGIGFPKDVDFRNTQTLGLQLVGGLVDQLNGTIELDRNSGTKIQITFI